MKKIILVIGLPGSGKTEFLKRIVSKNDLVVDDFTNKNQLPDHFDNTLYISDPHFCDSFILYTAETFLKDLYDDITIEKIYFENNKEKCLKNVLRRNDDRKVKGFIKIYSKVYNPPENSLKIWDSD